jgi:hypothetical protein
MKAQLYDRVERILLGNNTSEGAVTLQSMGFQCVAMCISTGLPCILTIGVACSDLRKITLASVFPERNNSVRREVSVFYNTRSISTTSVRYSNFLHATLRFILGHSLHPRSLKFFFPNILIARVWQSPTDTCHWYETSKPNLGGLIVTHVTCH